MLCCFFSVKLLVVYFFFGCTIRVVVVVFDCGFFIFFFFAVICLFFLMFLFAFFKKCSSSVFLWLFFIFFQLFFCGEGIFMATFFAVFFSFSLAIWRFLLSLPYMALYGLSSMCYICKTSNIWGQCTVVGTFLILKAINYFLCFCFHSVALEVVVADELELFMWWLIWKINYKIINNVKIIKNK